MKRPAARGENHGQHHGGQCKPEERRAVRDLVEDLPVRMLHHGGCRAGLLVIGHGARPELSHGTDMRKQEDQAGRREAGRRKPKAPAEEPQGSEADRHRRQLHGECRREHHARRNGRDRAVSVARPSREQHQGQCRGVGDHLRGEEVERWSDRQQSNHQQPTRRAAEAAPDEPAAYRAETDYDEQRGTQVDHADARYVREAAEQVVEAGELGREDVGAEGLAVAQRIDGGEVDALVVVGGGVDGPREEEALRDEGEREQSQLDRPGLCHDAERTIGSGDHRRDFLLGLAWRLSLWTHARVSRVRAARSPALPPGGSRPPIRSRP